VSSSASILVDAYFYEQSVTVVMLSEQWRYAIAVYYHSNSTSICVRVYRLAPKNSHYH